MSDDRIADGWGGRIGDLLQSANANNGISMSISLGGSNVFQSGKQTVEYAISPQGDGAEGIANYNDGTDLGDLRKAWIDQMLAADNGNLLRREYARRLRNTIDAREVFVDALQASTGPTTSFSPGPFSQSLRQIARTIGARNELGACRQTFFVLVGGWDTMTMYWKTKQRCYPLSAKGWWNSAMPWWILVCLTTSPRSQRRISAAP